MENYDCHFSLFSDIWAAQSGAHGPRLAFDRVQSGPLDVSNEEENNQ